MRTALLIFLLAWSASVLGWGQTGHRAAAQVAEHFLSPEARMAVSEILGREDLARASTWPDFMRADPSELWQQTADPWHYVTVPPGHDYGDEHAPAEGDAYTALRKFSQILREANAEPNTEPNTEPDAEPIDSALALRFVVHIIADLHQPLHVGNGTDRGGNDFAVSFFGQTTNLHRVWDSQMIDHWQLSYTELADWLLDDITPADYRAWSDPDPKAWIAESAALRKRIYPEERDLFWSYGFEWKATVEKRVAQAGVRTAVYLNHLFAD